MTKVETLGQCHVLILRVSNLPSITSTSFQYRKAHHFTVFKVTRYIIHCILTSLPLKPHFLNGIIRYRHWPACMLYWHLFRHVYVTPNNSKTFRTGFFRLSAQSIVRPWAFIKGGRLIGPYRETHTVHLVYFNICTDMIVQFNTHPSI